MKKNISKILFLVLIGFLTGCGKKTLVCNGSINQNDVNYEVSVTGNFINDKLNMQTIKMETDLSNYLQYTTIESFYELYKEQYEKFNEYNGISTTVTKGDNSVIVVMEIDLNKVDSETYQKLDVGSGSLEISLEAFKEEFEKMDFTCE